MTRPDRLSDALGQLSRFLFSEETLDSTLRSIVTFAMESVPGCEYAGLSEMREGKLSVAFCTHDIVRRIDAFQSESGEGPLIDAINEREMISVESLQIDDRWPRFRAKAGGTVESILTLPLLVDHAIGSISVYSSKPGAFTAVDRSFLALFAAQAAVAVANAVTLADRIKVAEQLQAALDSRGVIEQAKGILMDRHRITADEAFAMLRKTSQDVNRKLRDIAQALVDSVARGTGERD